MKTKLINTVTVLLLILTPVFSFSQEKKVVQKQPLDAVIAAHRIVFQVASGDSMVHKQLMKQLGNILNVAPGTQLEVVCHGPGLDMLIAEKTVVAEKIKALHAKGINFQACEFSMKDRNVEKSQMIADASYVPYAIIHIATRQEQGWSYIKSGF